MWPVLSALPPAGKRCLSGEEVVPAPLLRERLPRPGVDEFGQDSGVGFIGSVALTCWAAGHLRNVPSSCDREDLEELVDKAHLVPDVRLASKAMSSTDHPHHLETLDGSGCCSHRLKASGRSNDLLECAMVRLDDVVPVFAGPMSCVSRQLAFPLQAIDSLRVGAELVCRNRGRRPLGHSLQCFS